MKRSLSIIGLALVAAAAVAPASMAERLRAGVVGNAARNDLSAPDPAPDAPAVSPAAIEELAREDSVEIAPLSIRYSGKFNPVAAVPIEDLRATRERPLFSASRRPPPPVVEAGPVETPPPPPPPPQAPEQPQMTLVGVVRTAGSEIGLFTDPSGKSIRLRVGEEGNGWTVRSVGDRRAVLAKEAQEVTLELPARGAEITSPPPALAALASAGADQFRRIHPPPVSNPDTYE